MLQARLGHAPHPSHIPPTSDPLSHFVLQGGTLSYYPEQVYPDKDDKAKLAKSCLGTLHLANCSVRLPTDLKSKGKYQSTCFRLDLDPATGSLGGYDFPEVGSRTERGRENEARGNGPL